MKSVRNTAALAAAVVGGLTFASGADGADDADRRGLQVGGQDGRGRAGSARADGVHRQRRLLRVGEGDRAGQAGQGRRGLGRPGSDGQLELRARAARHRARQVLQVQRLGLPVLERDDAAGGQRASATRCRCAATGWTASTGTGRRWSTRRRCTAAARCRRTRRTARTRRCRCTAATTTAACCASDPKDGTIYLQVGDTGRRGQRRTWSTGRSCSRPVTARSATTSSAGRTRTRTTSRA